MLQYERIGGTGLVKLNAPRRNALTPALSQRLMEALDEAEAAPEVTAFAIVSSGPAFCSGADLNLIREVGHDPLEDGNYRSLGDIYQLFVRLLEARIPTVAGVNGAVVGAGINLALACDVRIVSEDLRVVGFARAGVHPGGGHLAMMSRLAGSSPAAVTLLGQELDADRAVSCGFAWTAVPAAELLDTVLSVAAGAGSDGALTRQTTASWRATAASQLTPESAVMLERGNQLWSLRRGPTAPPGANAHD